MDNQKNVTINVSVHSNFNVKSDNVRNFEPTDQNQRIEILDALRGFALLGIIFNNMLFFGGYVYTPFEKLSQILDLQFNENIFYFLDVVITAKFYTLFSILFAVGFYIQLNKHRGDSVDFLKIYRRRLLILLFIGLFHSLIWSGDILFLYAIMGFILILFRNIRSKNLIHWSLFFILLPFLIDLTFLPFFQSPNIDSSEKSIPVVHLSFPDMNPEVVLNTFQNGTIGEVFILNIHNIVWKYLSYFPSGGYFKFLGIFILGYYLASIGFFTEKSKSTLLLIISLIVGLSATISANVLAGNPYQFPPTPRNIFYKFLESTGQMFLCFFYITSLFKIIQTSQGKWVLKYLIPVGRMSLTNYLVQTVIMIIIFYNFGFGLFGRVGLITTSGIVILVLIIQIIFSNIWVRHFRLGPFEWLWRSLTYKRWIKIR